VPDAAGAGTAALVSPDFDSLALESLLVAGAASPDLPLSDLPVSDLPASDLLASDLPSSDLLPSPEVATAELLVAQLEDVGAPAQGGGGHCNDAVRVLVRGDDVEVGGLESV